MPYKRIELVAQDLDLGQIGDLLEEVEAVDRYQAVVGADGPDRIMFVVDGARTEAVVNAIQQRFGNNCGFRLMIYDLAALWPRPQQEEPEPPTPDEPPVQNRHRISREELLDDLEPGSHISAVYLGQVMISCLVAAVGMMRDSVALVIAAMVIAPLLLPNMALALGTTLGELTIVRRSLRTGIIGLGVGLGLALLVGLIFPVDPTVREIASRGQVQFADVIVALAAGAAGAIAVTTGVSANLIGVMVAVALVPPLVAVGMLLSAGQYKLAGGAGLLLAINIVSVNLAAIIVFLIQGIRPNTWYEAEAARRATRTAIACWIGLLMGLALLIYLAAPANPLRH